MLKICSFWASKLHSLLECFSCTVNIKYWIKNKNFQNRMYTYLGKKFAINIWLLSAIMNRLEKHATLKRYLSPKAVINNLSPKMQLLEISLHRAIKQHNFEEFEIYYQPIVDIASGKIVAAESLLRWQSPEVGLIYMNSGHWALGMRESIKSV
ncbi:EAL domain-containing protein [Nostoc commune]|uniref:EAL domain-containing protein n=1 Tax=Nostoc commune TaxID=1178 RepID=UPI003F776BA3